MKLVTTKFKSGGLHEKHVVAIWNLGNHLSICFWTQGNQEKPVSRWPVTGPSGYWLLASSPASKVGFVIRIYDDARSPEPKRYCVSLALNARAIKGKELVSNVYYVTEPGAGNGDWSKFFANCNHNKLWKHCTLYVAENICLEKIMMFKHVKLILKNSCMM